MTGLLAGATGPGISLASASPWQPPPCPPVDPPGVAADTSTHYQLAAMLDETGTLVAQRFEVFPRGGSVATMDLPPETFASGPVRGLVVLGDDDGIRSRLRLVDRARGCVRFEAVEPAVIRSALIALDGSSLWEHRVDRATRADLGVWTRSLADRGSVRVLAGIDADPDYGPTFSTELRESADGHLSVASCGALACRTRIVDPRGPVVGLVAGTGPPIGFTQGQLVAHAACDWWPCPIVAVDPKTSERQTLVDAAYGAELGGAKDGFLIYQGPGGDLEVMDVASRAGRSLAGAQGLAPVRRGSHPDAGFDMPVGEILVAPDGRVDGSRDTWRLDPTTETLSPAAEAQP
jgi:hypothetical protein